MTATNCIIREELDITIKLIHLNLNKKKFNVGNINANMKSHICNLNIF